MVRRDEGWADYEYDRRKDEKVLREMAERRGVVFCLGCDAEGKRLCDRCAKETEELLRDID